MTDDGMPPLTPLAPIVDRMQAFARDELPAPRRCQVKLWDDDTFQAIIEHAMGDDEYQLIRYESATSEIVWEHRVGVGWKEIPLSGGETIREPTADDIEVRVLATVEPPYR